MAHRWNNRGARWAKQQFPLRIILIAFVALSILYHRATPPLEAGDEAGHFAFVLHLMEIWMLLVISVLNVFAVAYWTSFQLGSQGRLLFPSLAVNAVLCAVGIRVWGRLPARIIIVTAFLFLTVLYGTLSVIPAQYAASSFVCA